MSLPRAGALACLPTCPIAHLPQLGTVPLPPALESCVGLFAADRPHAAPALAEGPREGRGLRGEMVPHAQAAAAQRHARQEAAGRPAADEDDSLRAIATTVLEVFLAGT
jgi:hypothetical protein